MKGENRKRNSAAAKQLSSAFAKLRSAKTPDEQDRALEAAFEAAKGADVDGMTTAERRELTKALAASRRR